MMLYEFWKEITVSVATKNIQEVDLDYATLRKMKKWFAKFHRDDFNLEDKPRSKHSSIIDDILRALIANNARISTEEVSEALNLIGHVSAFKEDGPHSEA